MSLMGMHMYIVLVLLMKRKLLSTVSVTVHLRLSAAVCVTLPVPSPFIASLFGLESASILAASDHSNCSGTFLNACLVLFRLVM